MSETLDRPDPKEVARDLVVDDTSTFASPEPLSAAKPLVTALAVPPMRADRNGLAIPTPNPNAPTTRETPNYWGADPLFASAHTIINGGEGAHGDPNARNPYSGATGINQFIRSTFVPLMKQHHPELTTGKSDEEIWAMASDREINERAGAELAHDNAKALQAANVPVTPQTIAGAHRLGAGAMTAILKASPDTPLRQVAPNAATPGNDDIANLTVGQFLANPYPRGGGGGPGEPGDAASYYRIQQNARMSSDALEEMRRNLSEDRERIREMAKDYKPFHPAPPPAQPVNDPLQAFGGIASIFVALAAGLSKTPAIAAMNGMAGAIDGARERDWTKYTAEYKTWKDSTQYAIEAHKQYSDDIEQAMKLMTTDRSSGEALFKSILARGDDYEQQFRQWRLNPLQWQEAHDKAVETRLKMEEQQRLADDDLQLRGANANRDQQRELLKAAEQSGDPVKIEEAQRAVKDAEEIVQRKLSDIEARKRANMGGYRTSTSAGNLTAQQEIQLLNDFKKAHPDATDDDVAREWNRIRGKEDPLRRSEQRDEALEAKRAKDAADADYKQKMAGIAADKSKNPVEIANARLAFAREKLAKDAELAVKKLDQNASQVERRQVETERHDKITEGINQDKALNDKEKAQLRLEEDIRWHGVQARQKDEAEQGKADRWLNTQRAKQGSASAERAARFEEIKAAMPPGTSESAIWDKVDRDIMMAKAPRISESAARNVAEQVVAGNTGALSGFGRNPAMLAQIENQIADVAAEKGMSGADIVRIKAQYSAYTKALKDFSTGKQGQVAQSLNVATQHLALLGQAAEALANNDTRTLNLVQNAFQNEFGWEEPITFNAIKTIVGSEIEKAVTGSAGAVEDRRDLRQGLSADSTPKQLASVIEGYKGLMAGQLQGLERTYERTTNRTDFRDEFLLPEARREMDRIAPRPSGASGALPQSAVSQLTEGHETTFGNGQTWTLKNGQPVRIK